MAQEPKRRHSKSRKRVRRASILLKSATTISCKNCGKLTLPHMICGECGFYGGKKISKEKVTVTKI